ncbi:MAG TPA: sodium/solute symporter [Phycisphaerae bacterium]|nr:sodium/solute symporter [Phycisphaerae bacterium]HRR87289.1 sodium/solute symporter [Phycisphaerae bacterium]
MGLADILVFVLFVAAVIAVGLWKSRGEETRSEHGAQDYFLAGRGLTWWLVGFSLIAANISTEQFVGMSGKAADWLGMAIASYEWMAAITLVVVAFLFLPKFLKSGIYTIPEFLEYRYNTFARTVMAISTLIILVGVPTASVIYSGAKVITVNFQGQSVFGFDLGSIEVGCWIIGTLAAIYVFAGGLKACAWADLIQGSALIVGGVIIAFLAMRWLGNADPGALAATATAPVDATALGGAGALERLRMLNAGDWATGKLHMVKPASDPEVPWTALVVGLWIPNFFYWGLNQYITQRTLGSKSLAEGQRGVVFAAFLKLLVPFVVVIPGILAYNLFSGDLRNAAVVKNAKAIAAFAPDLYPQLSDDVKPDAADPLYVNDLKAINRQLDRARTKPPQDLTVFRFTGSFAEDHTADAACIVSFNAAALGVELPNEWLAQAKSDPQLLMNRNADLLKKAGDKEFKGTVRELVLRDYDAAFPVLIKNLLPLGSGLKGFVLAAIFGAVVSSLASMLNSSSTIFAMDIFRKLKKDATQFQLVTTGRICVVAFVLIAMLIAPRLDNPKFGGIFTFIQEFQGFISPGILAIFLFGVLVHRAPRACGTAGLLLNPVLYGGFKWWIGPWMCAHGLWWSKEMSFLDRMAVCFFIVLAVLTVMRLAAPMPRPVDLPVNPKMNLESKGDVKIWGTLVVLATLALYVVFW